ncbi:hypothetical protein JCM10212_003778 [Sporobolomyces blumeae]
MTSHLVDAFAARMPAIAQRVAAVSSSPLGSTGDSATTLDGRDERAQGKDGEAVDGCTFCEIVGGIQDAHTVYEDDDVLAFLDILPIRPGHLLVVPKRHFQRVTNLPDDLSAKVGRALPRIARGLCRAMEQPDFNIVSNQGHAQVVPHIHFHLVPAPHAIPTSTALSADPASQRSTRLWFGRHELDDEEGRRLAGLIKAAIDADGKAKL